MQDVLLIAGPQRQRDVRADDSTTERSGSPPETAFTFSEDDGANVRKVQLPPVGADDVVDVILDP